MSDTNLTPSQLEKRSMENNGESKRKRGRPRRSTQRKIHVNERGGLHGLVGLEISALRKTFNGETNYNFDKYLKTAIPEQYTIEVVDDKERQSELFRDTSDGILTQFENDELKDINICDGDFNKIMKSFDGKFEVGLVDHEKNKGPSKLVYTVGSDPLDDIMYLKTHDKFARKERKFALVDKSRILNEVDNCIELLSLLGTDIKRGALKETLRNYVVEDVELSDEQIYRLSQLLGTITSINDPTDSIEMILKYRLTIREIRSFLLNFMKIKTLEGFLKKEVQRINAGLAERYNEPVTESDVKELRKKRLSIRDSRMGKVVKVNFKDGVTLVVDPISKPKVN